MPQSQKEIEQDDANVQAALKVIQELLAQKPRPVGNGNELPSQKVPGGTAHLVGIGSGGSKATWLQVNAPQRLLSDLVTWLGTEYHTIAFDRRHLVFLIDK